MIFSLVFLLYILLTPLGTTVFCLLHSQGCGWKLKILLDRFVCKMASDVSESHL